MTLQYILRTFIVAGVATLALVAAKQARAESGDGASVYSAIAVSARAAEQSASEAEVDEATVVEPAEPTIGAVPAKRRGRPEAVAVDGALRSLVMRYAAENEIPFSLADAVVRIESRYDSGARNGPHVGLTQISVQTAQSMGYKGSASGLLDPETNLRYGLKYLAQAHKLAGGDTCGTILRYQAGHRARTMTGAARAYCAKVQTILASADAI